MKYSNQIRRILTKAPSASALRYPNVSLSVAFF